MNLTALLVGRKEEVVASGDKKAGWWHSAVCASVDPEIFFSYPKGVEAARRICNSCPVQRECLEAALKEEGTLPAAHREGMRGGVTAKKRYKMSR